MSSTLTLTLTGDYGAIKSLIEAFHINASDSRDVAATATLTIPAMAIEAEYWGMQNGFRDLPPQTQREYEGTVARQQEVCDTHIHMRGTLLIDCPS